MIAEQLQEEHLLADDMAALSHDPLGFVRYAFPWGEKDLTASPGPRVWQRETLELIGKHLQDANTRHQPCLIAVSSGHDIGKSALISMITCWAMSTCEDCRIGITAGTSDQLNTKTVPEVQKWFRMASNAHWWDLFATSIRVKDLEHHERWRTDFLTWSIHRSEAFAGLHNLRKRMVIIFDEASGIADKIWEVTEGVLLDEETEIIWIAFGNPTKNSGRFREIFGKYKHRWHTRHIDSRTVEGTNKVQIDKWIADYGEDSDFVRVRVRGEFPRVGSNQFIGADTVAECRRYKADGFTTFPKILGVDVARFGDDQTVLCLRQGRKAEFIGKYRGIDTAQVTALVIQAIEAHEVNATVVDSDGIGATVFDQLKFRGYSRRLFEFHGGKPAVNASAYFNQRAEIWGTMRDWLMAGAEIPDDPELEMDLTGPQYGFSPQQQIQLEKKDDMKKRGVNSPDCGDALAMTFAVNVTAPNLKKETRYVYPGQTGTGWMG